MSFYEQNLNTSGTPDGFELAVSGFLSGPVSRILAVHQGFVRLERMSGATAIVELGGGCTSCPKSNETLKNIVLRHLQDRFGDESIQDVSLSERTTPHV